MSNITQRLRNAVQTLRRTPMPIADVSPMLTDAADEIERLTEARKKSAGNVWELQMELTTLRAAAQQGLEALMVGIKAMNHYGLAVECMPLHDARTALKAALKGDGK